ncbi:MAG TPA: methyltransferase domain-containing protein [Burkholderiales bacterium]
MSTGQNDPTRFWEERYRSATTHWDRGGTSPALLEWLEQGALTPSRILVPGCGRGYEALELARRGFEVVALDFAPSAVRHLRDELLRAGLRAEVHEADVLAWTAEHPFDAIYEQTCLCALPPKTWARYEEQLRGWLRPGGRLLALFMQTHKEGGPPYHCDPGAMRGLFAELHWEWSGAPFCEVPHPAGFYELSTILTRRP